MSNKERDFFISFIKAFSLISVTWGLIFCIEKIIAKNYTIVNFTGTFPIIIIIPFSLLLSHIFHILPRYFNIEENNSKQSIGIFSIIFLIIIGTVFLISPYWTIMSPRWVRLLSLGPDVPDEINDK